MITAIPSEATTETAPSRVATRWHCSVADFARMADAGIFSADRRVELLEGEIHHMSPIGPRHGAVVKRLLALLSAPLAGRAILSVQDPLQLSDDTQPQPDLALLRPRADFYASAHPRAADVLLVIEVADSSLAYDRNEKLPRYASANIPEVWLFDLTQSLVTRFTQPVGDQYQVEQSLAASESLVCPGDLGIRFVVGEVLGS